MTNSEALSSSSLIVWVTLSDYFWVSSIEWRRLSSIRLYWYELWSIFTYSRPAQMSCLHIWSAAPGWTTRTDNENTVTDLQMHFWLLIASFFRLAEGWGEGSETDVPAASIGLSFWLGFQVLDASFGNTGPIFWCIKFSNYLPIANNVLSQVSRA